MFNALRPALVSTLPFLGVGRLYKLQLKRIIQISISLAVSIVVFILNSYSRINLTLLIISIIFICIAFLLNPQKVIRTVYSVIHSDVGSQNLIKDENSQVIGISIKDEAVCWSVSNMVIPRHLVNDYINGIPVIISYCALCMSGIPFKAEIQGKKLTFGLVGVWRKNLVMNDKETGSIWQQETGECVYGEHKGKKLEIIFYEQTSFKNWVRRYPDTKVAVFKEADKKGLFSDETWNKLFKLTKYIRMPGLNSKDKRLKPEDEVVVVRLGNKHKVYPMYLLEELKEINDTISDKQVFIYYDKNNNTAYSFLKNIKSDLFVEGEIISDKTFGKWNLDGLSLTGGEKIQRLISERHWWKGWSEFHVNSEIYEKNK